MIGQQRLHLVVVASSLCLFVLVHLDLFWFVFVFKCLHLSLCLSNLLSHQAIVVHLLARLRNSSKSCWVKAALPVAPGTADGAGVAATFGTPPGANERGAPCGLGNPGCCDGALIVCVLMCAAALPDPGGLPVLPCLPRTPDTAAAAAAAVAASTAVPDAVPVVPVGVKILLVKPLMVAPEKLFLLQMPHQVQLLRDHRTDLLKLPQAQQHLQLMQHLLEY